MELNEFKRTIGRIYLYFDKLKNFPNDAAIELWFDKVKHIPDPVLDFIYKNITDNHEAPPKNIGNAFRDAWSGYKSSNPDKFIGVYDNCPDCRNYGFFQVEVYNEGLRRKFKSIVRCGNCNNWRRHWAQGVNILMVQKDQLEQMNYELKFPLPRNSVSGQR